MDSCLEKLFTVTDYQLRNVKICNSCNSDDESAEIPLSVDVWCSPQATTDYYLTGQILWPVSILTSHYMAHLASKGLLRDKSIVELGSGGTALPSIVAAKQGFARHVLATDGNEGAVWELLQKNVDYYNDNPCRGKTESNAAHEISSTVSNLSAQRLVWGDRSQVRQVLHQLPHIHVVVAADVVQWPAVVEPLLHTVKALLWGQTVKQRDDEHDGYPVFVLGLVNRASSTTELFFEWARKLGFLVRAISAREFLKDGIVPASCQEHGGRVTEIYELQLAPRNDCDPPLLLAAAQPDEALSNMTTGSGFEHTSSLPC